mmetsp:Transcript_44534/g.95673  ORF Transcript_44534/g.95673 Transcript_44534/m.95673 type:complete len:603 (+) Transcript_44534:99-1907(+)
MRTLQLLPLVGALVARPVESQLTASILCTPLSDTYRTEILNADITAGVNYVLGNLYDTPCTSCFSTERWEVDSDIFIAAQASLADLVAAGGGPATFEDYASTFDSSNYTYLPYVEKILRYAIDGNLDGPEVDRCSIGKKMEEISNIHNGTDYDATEHLPNGVNLWRNMVLPDADEVLTLMWRGIGIGELDGGNPCELEQFADAMEVLFQVLLGCPECAPNYYCFALDDGTFLMGIADTTHGFSKGGRYQTKETWDSAFSTLPYSTFFAYVRIIVGMAYTGNLDLYDFGANNDLDYFEILEEDLPVLAQDTPSTNLTKGIGLFSQLPIFSSNPYSAAADTPTTGAPTTTEAPTTTTIAPTTTEAATTSTIAPTTTGAPTAGTTAPITIDGTVAPATTDAPAAGAIATTDASAAGAIETTDAPAAGTVASTTMEADAQNVVITTTSTVAPSAITCSAANAAITVTGSLVFSIDTDVMSVRAFCGSSRITSQLAGVVAGIALVSSKRLCVSTSSTDTEGVVVMKYYIGAEVGVAARIEANMAAETLEGWEVTINQYLKRVGYSAGVTVVSATELEADRSTTMGTMVAMVTSLLSAPLWWFATFLE